MSPAATVSSGPNPLRRIAARLPVTPLVVLQVAALALGVVFAFVYAYDQDTLFPERHLPRTWVLVSVASVVALGAAAVAHGTRGRRWLPAVLTGLSGGALFFAGANLANESTGGVTLACGAIALLAGLALAERRGQPAWGVVIGALVAAGLTFAVVGLCVVLVSGSA
jgi:hypothetical protein